MRSWLSLGREPWRVPAPTYEAAFDLDADVGQGASGIDHGLLGRLDVYEAMFSGQAPRQPRRGDAVIAPSYSGFPVGEECIAEYVRRLVEE